MHDRIAFHFGKFIGVSPHAHSQNGVRRERRYNFTNRTNDKCKPEWNEPFLLVLVEGCASKTFVDDEVDDGVEHENKVGNESLVKGPQAFVLVDFFYHFEVRHFGLFLFLFDHSRVQHPNWVSEEGAEGSGDHRDYGYLASREVLSTSVQAELIL